MFRFGVCTQIDNIECASRLGYDFLECSFAWLNSITDNEFFDVLRRVDSTNIRVEACNGMLPPTLKVVGNDINVGSVREYLSKTFKRAQKLGVNVVVFGSGAARGVPEGYPFDKAWKDIANYLMLAEEYCSKYNIVVAIEPLRRKECNILNYVSEGTLLSALLDLPHIGVLGDTHHMICGNEPFEALAFAGEKLKHVHISHSYGNDGGRDYPSKGDDNDYCTLFEILRNMKYNGRISIEAGYKDFQEDSIKAMEIFSEYRD